MARQPVRNQVPQNPITAGVNAEAQQQAFAEAARRADENARAQNATQAAVKAATATGIPLPPGAASKGQSPANRAAIARSVAAGVAGNQMAPTPPIFQPSHMPSATHMPNGTPSYSPSGATPSAVPAFPGSSTPLRGSTPAEIADFNKGATPANEVAAAAGTGRNVTTPYGDVSSAPDKFSGQVQGPNLAGPAGKPNWQQEVVNAHPAIGKPGTPENKAFVDAWKAKYPNGSPANPTDHMDIADAAVGNANRLPGSPLTLQSGVQPTADPNSLAPTSKEAALAAAKGRTAALENNRTAFVPGGNGGPVDPTTGGEGRTPTPAAVDTTTGLPANAQPSLTPPPIPAGAQTPNSTPASRGVTYSPNPDVPTPSATPTVDRVAAQQAAPVDLKAAKSYADVFHSSVGPLFGAGGDTPAPSSASFNPQSFALSPSTPSNSGMGAVPSYVPAQNDQNSNTANF